MFSSLVAGIDRAVQKNLGGVTVTYRPEPELADPVDVQGIFDSRYVLILESGDSAGVEQAGPAVFLRLDELPVHPDDCNPRLTIAGVDYQVRERQPDGLGGIRLLLQLAAVP